MAKGKHTDSVRPIVTILLTLALIYGFTVSKTITGEQMALIYMSVIGFLFEQVKSRISTGGEKDEE